MSQQRKKLTPERSRAHRWGLRTRRDQAGLSLAKLGTIPTFDPSYLARLERGDQFPSENAAQACDTALSAGGELIRQRRGADRERHQAAEAPAACAVTAADGAVELPPFSEDAKCPKCESGNVTVTCHPAPAEGHPGQLCRVCGRCGYGWCEAPAGA